uniref:Glutaredoxin domain-containing protein n=1 Tax=Oncorhynchus kisutch TaxID=8019 RepID=A0A8C7CE35_ONCKI
MAQEFVTDRIKGDKVVVFLKPSCAYCVMAKYVLSKYGFKSGHLEFIDITGRDDMNEIQDYLNKMTGERTKSNAQTGRIQNTVLVCIICQVPRVFVGKKCVLVGAVTLKRRIRVGNWRECLNQSDRCNDFQTAVNICTTWKTPCLRSVC